MIEQKYVDLMNQELDGANTPAQTRELETYLQGNPAARDHYRELALALNLFEKVAMVDPPPGLAAAIVDRAAPMSKDSTVPSAVPEGLGLWAACRQLFRQRPRLAHAMTFSAGLACGLLLLSGSLWLDDRHGAELDGKVLGTANVQERGGGQVTSGQWQDPAVQGLYRARLEGRDLGLGLEVQADQPAVLRITHGQGTSLQHFHTDNPAASRLTVSATAVEVNLTGRGSYELEFHRIDESVSPMEMSVFSEGRLVHTESLPKGD